MSIYIVAGIGLKSDLNLPDFETHTELNEKHWVIQKQSFDLPVRMLPKQQKFREGNILYLRNGENLSKINFNLKTIEYLYHFNQGVTAQNHFLGVVFPHLLWDIGDLLLHGSAVEIDGKAYVWLGESGAGKSTKALSLIYKNNASLLSDDIVVIRYLNEKPFVIPYSPRIKILESTLELLGLNELNLNSLELRPQKKTIIAERFSREPIPLESISFLKNKGQTNRRKGVGKVKLLLENVHRSRNKKIFCKLPIEYMEADKYD